MAFGAFVKPEDTLGAEDRLGKLIIEKMLEPFDGKGTIALKRDGGEAIDRQMVRMVMMVVMIVIMLAVSMLMVAV